MHLSHCAVHNAPAFPAGDCDCSYNPANVAATGYPPAAVVALARQAADLGVLIHIAGMPFGDCTTLPDMRALAARQERLGPEFEAAIFDNIDQLYEA